MHDRSKTLVWLIMSILYILICFSYDDYDYLAYVAMYGNSMIEGMVHYEALFVLLMKIGNLLGLSYNGFRIVVSLIELLLINSTVKRYASSSSMSWALYVLFPAWITTVTARHALAMSILVFALRFLINDEHGITKNTFLYLACVVVAALIHSSYWTYIILILVKVISDKKILISAIIFAATVWVLGYTNFLFRIYSLLPIRVYTIERYLTNSYSSVRGVVYDVLRQSLIVFWGCYSVYQYNKYQKDHVMNISEQASQLFMRYVVPINFVSIFFLGPLYYTSVASRLNHVVVLVNAIASSLSIREVKRNTLKRLITKALALGIVLTLSVLMCTIESPGTFEHVILMFLKTNDVLNFLR